MRDQTLVWLLTALLVVPICIVFPLQVHMKQQNKLQDWGWVWVFWPYWMLASICLAIAGWTTCRMLGTSDPKVLKQSSDLRMYNVGFFLLLALPLTGSCYLDGLISNEAAYVPPVLALAAAVALYLMHISRPCSGVDGQDDTADLQPVRPQVPEKTD